MVPPARIATNERRMNLGFPAGAAIMPGGKDPVLARRRIAALSSVVQSAAL